MRNPERIDVICKHLARLWKKKYSDYRLGQLMWAIAGRDPFFIEDYDAIKTLASMVGEELDTSVFPEYYIEPNAWKELMKRIPEIARKAAEKC